ncbi:MAG: exonuclease SbcCD subunit D [Algoriphagus sp.]
MLKILHTADWHLGKRLQEFSRLEEQKEVLDEICSIADQEEIDLVLLAGDIFDTFNPAHEAVELLYKTLRRLSKNGTRPIIAISGNHDSTQFVEAPDPLARELGIIFYSRYDSIVPCGILDSGITLLRSESGFLEFKLPQHHFPIRIILAPYANEVLLRTNLGEEDKEAVFRDLLAKKWQHLADTYCDDQGVNLFLGHFYFIQEGDASAPLTEPESERPILHIGGSQALFTQHLPQQVQYVALGHLHRYQTVSSSPCPVVYSSSPLAYSFSEADQEKNVVLIHARPQEPIKFQPFALKRGRPLYRVRFSSLEETLAWLEQHPYCFVEITYLTEESIDASTRRAIFKAHDGIVNLIPQLKHTLEQGTMDLRVDDLKKDMESLFRMYYKSEKGQEPNAYLLDLFKEVLSKSTAS